MGGVEACWSDGGVPCGAGAQAGHPYSSHHSKHRCGEVTQLLGEWVGGQAEPRSLVQGVASEHQLVPRGWAPAPQKL